MRLRQSWGFCRLGLAPSGPRFSPAAPPPPILSPVVLRKQLACTGPTLEGDSRLKETRSLRPGPLKSCYGQRGPKWTDRRPLLAPPPYPALNARPCLRPTPRKRATAGQPEAVWPYSSPPLSGAWAASGAVLISQGLQALTRLRERRSTAALWKLFYGPCRCWATPILQIFPG